jgi:flagellar L-ring protein precursor FlgH
MRTSLILALLAAATPIAAQAPDSSAKPAPSVTPATAPVNPYFRGARASWTSDRRAFQPGDVITVLIDEYTLASATTGTKATENRKTDASFGIDVTSTPKDGSFKTQNNGNSEKSGEASRDNRFQGQMSVRVVSVDANGLMQVKGTKAINVDKYKQFITVSGWVRPQDVSPTNTVDSWRLGDAEVVYTSEGKLAKSDKGFIGKALGWIWP